MALCKYCGTENNAHHSASCPVTLVQYETPVTEFPDVQRLITQIAKLQVENRELKNDLNTIETMYNALKPVSEQLQAANKDYARRLLSHMKGEGLESICDQCGESFWYVDDETIDCPRCKTQEIKKGPLIAPGS